jgi:hypothetical protein
MKNQLFAVLALTLLAAFNSQLSTAFAQGSLTPPGAPAPTMKSLDQIEARTPISSVPFSISQPGSYYLTTNLNVTTGDAITISANDVTFNLNGFTISSTRPSASFDAGIVIGGGFSDVTILNGHIKGGVTNNAGVYGGSGFGYGINDGGAQNFNIHVTGVSVSGCLYSGIFLGNNNSTIVESCTVRNVGQYGIYAQSIFRSAAYQCGDTAIQAGTATDCYGQSVGTGFSAGVNGVTANECYGYNTTNGIGIKAGTAIGCYGYSYSGYGVSAYIGNSCQGVSSFGTNEIVSFKYNMP